MNKIAFSFSNIDKLIASLKFIADGGSNRLYDAFKHDEKILEQ
jgi:hypothetical protein